jgi:hypothetical protein
MIKDDLAMPTNLVDPKSGATYRQAAGQLTAMINQGVAVANVPQIAYFENLWPGAAGKGLTATQNIYNLYKNQGGDYTTALYNLDVKGGSLCCSVLGPYAIFNAQYGELAALRSRGSGNYHAMQWTLRKRFSAGVQFDFNYTYSKSIDLASLPENNATTPGSSAQINSTSIINSWFTNDVRAVSDYDVQHNFSALWIAELPVGRGKRMLGNANRVVDGILGGWSLNGVFRNSSGLPTSVIAPAYGRLTGRWAPTPSRPELCLPLRLPETGRRPRSPASPGRTCLPIRRRRWRATLFRSQGTPASVTASAGTASSASTWGSASGSRCLRSGTSRTRCNFAPSPSTSPIPCGSIRIRRIPAF